MLSGFDLNGDGYMIGLFGCVGGWPDVWLGSTGD
jgi:hypothetical protein